MVDEEADAELPDEPPEEESEEGRAEETAAAAAVTMEEDELAAAVMEEDTEADDDAVDAEEDADEDDILKKKYVGSEGGRDDEQEENERQEKSLNEINHPLRSDREMMYCCAPHRTFALSYSLHVQLHLPPSALDGTLHRIPRQQTFPSLPRTHLLPLSARSSSKSPHSRPPPLLRPCLRLAAARLARQASGRLGRIHR